MLCPTWPNDPYAPDHGASALKRATPVWNLYPKITVPYKLVSYVSKCFYVL